MRGRFFDQGGLFYYIQPEPPIPRAIPCARCGSWCASFEGAEPHFWEALFA